MWRGADAPVIFSSYGGGVRHYFQTKRDEFWFNRYMAAQGYVVIELGEEDDPERKEPPCCGAGAPHVTRSHHANYPRQLLDDIEDILGFFKTNTFWGAPIILPTSKVISYGHSFGGYTGAMILTSDRAHLFDAYYLSAGSFNIDTFRLNVLDNGSQYLLFRTLDSYAFYDFGRHIRQYTQQNYFFFNEDSRLVSDVIKDMTSPPPMPVHVWFGEKDEACPPSQIIDFYTLLKHKGFNVSWSSNPLGHALEDVKEYREYFSTLSKFINAVINGGDLEVAPTPVTTPYDDLRMQEKQKSIVTVSRRLPEMSLDLLTMLDSVGRDVLNEAAFLTQVDAFIQAGEFILPRNTFFHGTERDATSSRSFFLGHSLFGPSAGGTLISRLEELMNEVYIEMESAFRSNVGSYFGELKTNIIRCLEAWTTFNEHLPEEDRMHARTMEYFRTQLASIEDTTFRTLDNYLTLSMRLDANRLPLLKYDAKYDKVWNGFSAELQRQFEAAQFYWHIPMFKELIKTTEIKVFKKLRDEFITNKDKYVKKLMPLLKEIYNALPRDTQTNISQVIQRSSVRASSSSSGGGAGAGAEASAGAGITSGTDRPSVMTSLSGFTYGDVHSTYPPHASPIGWERLSAPLEGLWEGRPITLEEDKSPDSRIKGLIDSSFPTMQDLHTLSRTNQLKIHLWKPTAKLTSAAVVDASIKDVELYHTIDAYEGAAVRTVIHLVHIGDGHYSLLKVIEE